MQTVTFQCGHCGKLMGVGTAYLGQQVRCPHCQQVVLAPATSAPVPPAPEPSPPPPPAPAPAFPDPTLDLSRNEPESIFSVTAASEDLFEVSPSRPRLELPPSDLAAPSPAPEPHPSGLEQTGFLPHEPGPESTAAYVAPPREPPGLEPTSFLPETPAAPSEPVSNGVPGPIADLAEPSLAPARRPALSAPIAGNSLGFWILILSLVSYSILATVFVVILLVRQNLAGPGNLLRELPDVDGDTPGGQRKKVSWKVDEKIHRLPIPAEQRVGLNQTIQVGDLEITPRKVERKTVRVFVENWAEPEKCNNPSLVLHLRLRNVSSDFRFAPLDNYFDRHFNPRSGDSKPLTCLEICGKTFYGGPARWYPRDRDPNKRLNREWVEARQPVAEPLNPGQACDIFVCTDGNDETVSPTLAECQGTLLWRVHLRRGLVRVAGRDVPATAVIGVPFRKREIVTVDGTP